MSKSKKAITGKTLRTILIKEMEAYLKVKYKLEKEVLLKKILDTERLFRADYYLPEIKTILEVNGGAWNFGRHTYGKGYENDLMKINICQHAGIRYFQFTYDMLKRLEYKLFL